MGTEIYSDKAYVDLGNCEVEEEVSVFIIAVGVHTYLKGCLDFLNYRSEFSRLPWKSFPR